MVPCSALVACAAKELVVAEDLAWSRNNANAEELSAPGHRPELAAISERLARAVKSPLRQEQPARGGGSEG